MIPSSHVILPFRGVMPRIHPSVFLAPGVVVMGDVEIGEDSSLWSGCVLRGDMNPIRVGSRVNLQEGVVVHVSAEGKGAFIGNDITVGHQALLHDCTLEDWSFVGMKSAVMDGAVIESYGVLAAGALLTPHKRVASGELWSGSPAKFWRCLEEDEKRTFASRAAEYAALAKAYRES